MKYSLVIRGGRIIDPDNARDMKGDVGIMDGRIVEVGEHLDPTASGKVVDAAGKWVIPGVIDPHMHVSAWIGDYPGLSMMAREGVITALDMAGPPESVFRNIKDHGTGMNIAVLDAFTFTAGEGGSAGIADAAIRDRIRDAVRKGAWGVKLLGGHYPVSPGTTRKVIEHCAEMGVYVAFHAGTTENGSNLEGLREAVGLAGGHPLHMAHMNSYCRGSILHPLREAAEAAELLGESPNIWSESYLNLFNGTSGTCRENEILSHVTRTCCGIRGFSPDRKGLGEAIRAGFAHVVKFQGGENVLATGEEGFRYWEERDTDVTVSFPVNIPEVQMSLAVMKDRSGNFVVDALSTDGGGIPRNTMVRQGIELVKFGALTPVDLVRKISANTAKMLGLTNKGHLSVGADGDVTVLDPDKGRAVMGVSRGKIIMIDSIVIGQGGIVLTSVDGEESAVRSGVDYQVLDVRGALKNKKDRI